MNRFSSRHSFRDIFRFAQNCSFIFIFFFSQTGCLSRTILQSTDSDAEVRVPESSTVAKGSLEYASRGTILESTEVVVGRAGCTDKVYRISKRDELSVEGLLIGLYTLPLLYGVGLLWVGSFQDKYVLDYKCEPMKLGGR